MKPEGMVPARKSLTRTTAANKSLDDQTQIVVGRGRKGLLGDLKLQTLPDVSREHIRLRWDATSSVYIKDLSRLGTTVNGKVIPSSVETDQEHKLDKNIEVVLPGHASIGLAGVVFLDFESTGLS
jgi:hypothetical protein